MDLCANIDYLTSEVERLTAEVERLTLKLNYEADHTETALVQVSDQCSGGIKDANLRLERYPNDDFWRGILCESEIQQNLLKKLGLWREPESATPTEGDQP